MTMVKENKVKQVSIRMHSVKRVRNSPGFYLVALTDIKGQIGSPAPGPRFDPKYSVVHQARSENSQAIHKYQRSHSGYIFMMTSTPKRQAEKHGRWPLFPLRFFVSKTYIFMKLHSTVLKVLHAYTQIFLIGAP